MKFRSTASVDLDFKIDKARFQVTPGAIVDIDDEVAFCVKLHGLPLEPVDVVDAKDEAPKAKGKPAKGEPVVDAKDEAPKAKG